MLPIVAQVRNRALARVGILTDDDLVGLKLFPALNDVGTWELKLPHEVRGAFGQWVRHAMAAELATPGAGIVVELPGGRRFSGPVLSASFEESTGNTRGSWAFTGVSDGVVLADRLAFPAPATADAQASSKASAYDTRTAPAETLMHTFVNVNIGPGQANTRRDSRIIMGTSGARGATRTKSARFVNLLELCQELAVTDGLIFDVVQVGSKLEFRTSVANDLTASVRMDVHTDSLTQAAYAFSGPRASEVITLGQGEGVDRLITTRTTSSAASLATEWGRRIEVVSDARGAETLAELNASADELLADNATPITSVSVTPSAVNAREVGTAWWLGDKVTVNVAGVPAKATVTALRIEVTPEGIHVGATVGDPVGFSADRVTGSRLSSVESRVSSLERTAEGLPDRLGATGRQVTNLNDATEAGMYWANASAANIPLAATLVIQVERTDGRIVQTVHDPTTTNANMVKNYRRVWTGTAWTNWINVARHAPATAPTPASGWGIYREHPSGVATGSPYVLLSGGFCTVRLTLKNETGASVGFGGGLTVVSGLPQCAAPLFALNINNTATSGVGPAHPELGAYMSNATLALRGPGSIPANGLVDISGVYPVDLEL